MIDAAAVVDFKIAKGAVERAVCRRLRLLARQVPAEQAIVEIGAFKGRTTGFLALGAEEGNGATVTVVDPWDLRPAASWPKDYFDKAVVPEYGELSTFHAWRDHMARCGIEAKGRGRAPVEYRKGYAVQVGARWSGPIGLLWHDAEHTAEAVAADLEVWARHVVPGGWVALHDAGNPNFGVIEGARKVLGNSSWAWGSRELLLWHSKSAKARPDRRGALFVRRLA